MDSITVSMLKRKRHREWHLIDAEDAKKLIVASGGPGGVFRVPVSHLPKNLQEMSGIESYYASAYKDPQEISPGWTLQGEMAVGRIDQEKVKYYHYFYAKSVDGKLYFAGSTKKFPLHHVASASPVRLEELFGHHTSKAGNKRVRGGDDGQETT